jgi:hypothetical protein
VAGSRWATHDPSFARFNRPDELGRHSGTLAQAWVLAMRSLSGVVREN